MTMTITPKDNRRNQSGASTLTKVVFGGIFLAIAYTAYNIIPFFYYYFEFQNQLTAIIPVADTLTDAQIRQRLGKVMKELDLPADPKDLKIERKDHFMVLSLKYSEVFYISFRDKDYDIKKFEFEAYAEGPF